MARETPQSKFVAIRSMFIAGTVSRMRDIESIYPSLVAKSLGINHSRYIEKLYKPERFSVKNILEMAALFELEPSLIFNVIVKQLTGTKAGRKKL